MITMSPMPDPLTPEMLARLHRTVEHHRRNGGTYPVDDVAALLAEVDRLYDTLDEALGPDERASASQGPAVDVAYLAQQRDEARHLADLAAQHTDRITAAGQAEVARLTAERDRIVGALVEASGPPEGATPVDMVAALVMERTYLSNTARTCHELHQRALAEQDQARADANTCHDRHAAEVDRLRARLDRAWTAAEELADQIGYPLLDDLRAALIAGRAPASKGGVGYLREIEGLRAERDEARNQRDHLRQQREDEALDAPSPEERHLVRLLRSRVADLEATARVVSAAERLRALEAERDHAIAFELRRLAEQWDHEVAGARKRTAAMAAAEGWDDEDEHLNGRLDGKLSCAEDARRRAAELEATEPAAVEPQRQAWRIAVEVPLDAPGRDALFAAIANVVADWEPARRDGWDAHVYAEPVTVPAWKLAPDRDPTADAAEPRYRHADGRPCHGCQICLDGEHEPATSRHEGSA